MSVLKYFKNTPGRPLGGRQAPLPRPWAGPSGHPRGGGDRPPAAPGPAAVARGLGDRPLSPPQRATGPFFPGISLRI